MKVFNLCCSHGHGFEGWFASEDDYVDQAGRGLVDCPLCGDHGVSRLPSAPRLNLSGAREPGSAAAAPTDRPAAAAAGGDSAAALQTMWMQAVRQLMEKTEDVGPRFAEEARRIHYGEGAPRGIRGQASAGERQALHEEGIEVLSIPLPQGLKGPLQ